jgi:hypothetical protein
MPSRVHLAMVVTLYGCYAQASRISGITPADIALLMAHLS